MIQATNKQKLKQEFLHTLKSAILGALGMGLYYLTDGLFIGIALGDDGLSAIGLAWTPIVFIIALASGVGMGGAIQYAFACGKKDEELSSCYYTLTIVLLLLLSFLLTCGLLIFYEDLLVFLKVEGQVLRYVQDYVMLAIYCTFFQVMGVGLLPLVRNMGGHRTASIALTCGYLINVLLDYVLMILFPLGMLGCSIAYVSGQIVIATLCLAYVIKKRKAQFSFFRLRNQRRLKALKKLLSSGLSPFGVHFSMNVVSVAINRLLLIVGGSEALAGYMVVMYVFSFTNILHRGIMDGSQPLLSQSFGEGQTEKSVGFTKWMFGYSMILILLSGIVTIGFRDFVAAFFGASKAVSIYVAKILPLYLLGYVLVSFARTSVTYMYATEKNMQAAVLVYGEVVVTLLFLLILPRCFGLAGIWAAVICGYIVIALVAFAFLLIIGSTRKKL